jgi:superfamily I DNA/RNA helicase
MRRCREGLRPVFRLIPAKWRSLERDEEQLVRLTEQQQMVINGLQENRRISIRGGAGTGKTMLALWQAVEFARCGKQTLLLCFNKALVEWLNDRIQTETSRDIQERLTVATFHSLCASFFAKAKLPFRPPSDPKSQSDFWENEVPNKMFDRVIDLVPQVRFDAVIVDEAQDFARDWWLTVESLSREPDGPLVIFFDPNQNLFGKENTFPSTNASFRLNVNCRNTRKIHAESLRFIDAYIVSSPAVPEGIAPLVVSTSEEELRSTVDSVLKQWRVDYRLQPRQIAILSSKRQENTPFSQELRIAGLTITDDPSLWRNDGGVLFSTITAFKGLEADAVVLLVDNTITNRLDGYVATSRAKHLLAIVNVTVLR